MKHFYSQVKMCCQNDMPLFSLSLQKKNTAAREYFSPQMLYCHEVGPALQSTSPWEKSTKRVTFKGWGTTQGINLQFLI